MNQLGTDVCVCCVCVAVTHVADGSQLLSCVALLQQRPGVFAGVGAVVVHCEFGPHEVGPDRRHIGDEMFTPFHICHLLAAESSKKHFC